MKPSAPKQYSSPGMALRTYRALSPGLCQAAKLTALFSPKMTTGLKGRQGLMKRLLAAASRLNGCLWFHVTSVGEYEQARPIITAVRQEYPHLPLAVTHFSPSGMDYAAKRPCADFHDYLPLDHPDHMEQLVRAWQPRLLVFVKFDCWPNQILAADREHVPLVLLAGSLQPASARLKPLARPLFQDVFNRFAHLGVCTEEDKQRFDKQLRVTCPVTVSGDTRAEQVILRYEASSDAEVARCLRNLGGQLLILGSTWPPDEKLWFPILTSLLESRPELRIVLTPHEPLPVRLLSLEKTLADLGIAHMRLSALLAQADASKTRVILVDSIGVLAEIYRAGHLAYVGGSFTTGVHNTMEPAVVGMPVIQNAEEAERMVRQGVGFVLHRPADALATAGKLLANPTFLRELGTKARQVVLDQRGATERSMAIIRPFLNSDHLKSSR